jgi:hypothetical protein
MSGAKRQSGYRKAVTTGALEELPEPADDELVAVVRNSRGGNVFEVCFPSAVHRGGWIRAAHALHAAQMASAAGETMLVQLPSKFRKVLWIKRGTCNGLLRGCY